MNEVRDGRRCLAVAAVIVSLAVAAPAAAAAARGEEQLLSFSNTTPISILDAAAGSPYPSTITLPTLGPILKLRVKLHAVSHTSPDDIDILLVGPGGAKVLLQTDAGGTTPVSGATYIFDQDAGFPIADEAPPSTGVGYQASNYDTASAFPAPAPLPPYATSLDAFIGTPATGIWSLYVVDDTPGNTGSIAGGWSLEILTNLGVVTINASGAATPYPSNISVAGLTGTVTKVRVGLQGFIHTFPDDVDVLLVGPTGATLMLLSDAGGSVDANVNLLFDQAAAAAIPDAGPIVSGTFLPTNFGVTDPMPAPAPVGPYGASLDVFNTTGPNGTWSLFVFDDLGGDAGSIAAWSLEITTDTTAATTYTKCAFRKADFNLDNQTDILWRHDAAGQNVVWGMDFSTQIYGSFLNAPTVPDLNWKMVGTDDFNGDCKTDILWRHDGSGGNVVWFMDGMTRTAGVFLSPPTLPDTNWKIGGTGDVNLDGDADLVWRHAVSGEMAVWFMNGITRTSGAAVTPSLPNVSWKLAGVADFDANGKPDLIFHHQGSGEVAVWLMDGTNRVGGGLTTPPGIADTQWKVVAIGDYNGDNKPDIVWRHSTTGANVVWFMDGLTQRSAAGMRSLPDTNWRIVGPR